MARIYSECNRCGSPKRVSTHSIGNCCKRRYTDCRDCGIGMKPRLNSRCGSCTWMAGSSNGFSVCRSCGKEKSRTKARFCPSCMRDRSLKYPTKKTVCARCNEKPRSRTHPYCRPCSREWFKSYRISNPDTNRRQHNNRRARILAALGSFSESEWRAVVARQNSLCADCGLPGGLTADHIVPLSRGGCNFIFNIQGLCRACNAAKRDKIIDAAEFSLFDRVTA